MSMYVSTIHQRHRRTDGQSGKRCSHSNTVLCTQTDGLANDILIAIPCYAHRRTVWQTMFS